MRRRTDRANTTAALRHPTRPELHDEHLATRSFPRPPPISFADPIPPFVLDRLRPTARPRRKVAVRPAVRRSSSSSSRSSWRYVRAAAFFAALFWRVREHRTDASSPQAPHMPLPLARLPLSSPAILSNSSNTATASPLSNNSTVSSSSTAAEEDTVSRVSSSTARLWERLLRRAEEASRLRTSCGCSSSRCRTR